VSFYTVWTLSRHSPPRYEIETPATPGLPEMQVWKQRQLFQPFGMMKLAGLSFALSI
jgi:hypothetical protein